MSSAPLRKAFFFTCLGETLLGNGPDCSPRRSNAALYWLCSVIADESGHARDVVSFGQTVWNKGLADSDHLCLERIPPRQQHSRLSQLLHNELGRLLPCRAGCRRTSSVWLHSGGTCHWLQQFGDELSQHYLMLHPAVTAAVMCFGTHWQFFANTIFSRLNLFFSFLVFQSLEASCWCPSRSCTPAANSGRYAGILTFTIVTERERKKLFFFFWLNGKADESKHTTRSLCLSSPSFFLLCHLAVCLEGFGELKKPRLFWNLIYRAACPHANTLKCLKTHQH